MATTTATAFPATAAVLACSEDPRLRFALLCCEAMQAIEAAHPHDRRTAAEAWLASGATPPEPWETELARLLREDGRAGLPAHRAFLRRAADNDESFPYSPVRLAELTRALRLETVLYSPRR